MSLNRIILIQSTINLIYFQYIAKILVILGVMNIYIMRSNLFKLFQVLIIQTAISPGQRETPPHFILGHSSGNTTKSYQGDAVLSPAETNSTRNAASQLPQQPRAERSVIPKT